MHLVALQVDALLHRRWKHALIEVRVGSISGDLRCYHLRHHLVDHGQLTTLTVLQAILEL